ncbi:MAG: SHOCT domain-containing protein [Acidobacteriota bacterium]
MDLSSYFHRFLLSIVAAAPFYNLMKKSEHKYYIIAAVLIILNLIFNLIGNRAKKSVMFKPVSIAERKEFFKKFRTGTKRSNTSGANRTAGSRLEELKSMYDRGLITEKEYNEKKKEIINGL